MEKNKVLDIGNCDLDHPRIKKIIESDCSGHVVRAMTQEDADNKLLLEDKEETKYSLILINRVGAFDGKEAMPYINKLKSSERYRSIPVMLISNYEDAQEEAVKLGAVRGFGKDMFGTEKIAELVRPYISSF